MTNPLLLEIPSEPPTIGPPFIKHWRVPSYISVLLLTCTCVLLVRSASNCVTPYTKGELRRETFITAHNYLAQSWLLLSNDWWFLSICLLRCPTNRQCIHQQACFAVIVLSTKILFVSLAIVLFQQRSHLTLSRLCRCRPCQYLQTSYWPVHLFYTALWYTSFIISCSLNWYWWAVYNRRSIASVQYNHLTLVSSWEIRVFLPTCLRPTRTSSL